MIDAKEMAQVLAGLNLPSVQDNALAALAGLNPEPVCRVCMEPLDVRDTDLGTHERCDPRRPDGDVPMPTLIELSAALIRYDRASARSRQVAVGPSEIGVACDRRLAYALRGAPRQPDVRVPYAPLLGTAFHALIADAMRLSNDAAGRARWLIEQRVQASAEISGSTDAYDTDTDTVTDWKLVGESTMDKARRHGPTPQYKVQAHVYGRGWQRLGYDPKWVRIVFLPRWSHTIEDAFEWTAPYSRRDAEAALDRVRHLDAEIGPEPYWPDIPPTADCYFCPYHRRSTAPADLAGCPGVPSKKDADVADYLNELPPSPNA